MKLYFESFNKNVNCLYTYNEDNILSQDFQIVYAGDIYESDLIALSIHNGCDARGGFTDYKIFRCDWDMILDYSRFRISIFIESDKTPLFKKSCPLLIIIFTGILNMIKSIRITKRFNRF